MLVVRQRAACIAQRVRPSTTTLRQATRAYASEHGRTEHGDPHDHHHAPQVEESPGLALYTALGAVGLSMFIYSFSRDENSALVDAVKNIQIGGQKTWEERNTMRTDLIEQAAADKHMFQTVEKRRGFDLRTPELIEAGCPHNVPAGHYANLDHLVAHYRKEHLEEEERKLKRLADAKKVN